MEIWKNIIGYEGLYQVSNLGNVKSLNYNKTGKERLLISCDNGNGYLYLNLYKDKNFNKYSIHRLVAQIFIPNTENKKEVNHIDGNKLNNKLENLEWNTRSENIIHGFKTGLIKIKNTENNFFKKNNPSLGKFGKDNPKSKKVNQYTLHGEFIKKWDSLSSMATELGINIGHISEVCNGKRKTAGGFIFKYL